MCLGPYLSWEVEAWLYFTDEKTEARNEENVVELIFKRRSISSWKNSRAFSRYVNAPAVPSTDQPCGELHQVQETQLRRI